MTTGVHDYPTKQVAGNDLDATMVLVGKRGGLSAIYEKSGLSSVMRGLLVILTEHGPLFLDPDGTYAVLAMDGEVETAKVEVEFADGSCARWGSVPVALAESLESILGTYDTLEC